MTRTYELERSQVIQRDLEEVFGFFSDAGNLQRLTPQSLSFHITTPRPINMQAGTIIDYRLRLFGIPFHWKTRIKEFEPPRRFVDVQQKGPYKLWHHTHEFQAVAEGTMVVDHVRYQMPLGPLGGLAHALFVRRTLQKIFDFREARMSEIFPPRVELTPAPSVMSITAPPERAGCCAARASGASSPVLRRVQTPSRADYRGAR